MLKIPRGTVTGVITRYMYKFRGDVENLPQPRILSVTDTMSLVRLSRTNRKTALREITTQFNENRPQHVSK